MGIRPVMVFASHILVEFDGSWKLGENYLVGFLSGIRLWACGAAGSALPWHGRGRRFDPDQVHQIPQQVSQGEQSQRGDLCHGLCHNPPLSRWHFQ